MVNIIIGIMGTHRGAGTTHLAMMLSVFLGIVKGEKIALVEMNGRGCFRQARIIRSVLDAHKNKTFYKKISIFEQSELNDLGEIVSRGYSYVIVDFGSGYEANREPFLLCNVKIVVGSLSWWKLQHYVSFIAKSEGEQSGKFRIYLANCSTESGRKYLYGKFHIRVKEIPYVPDPYSLDGSALDFFDKLVSGWQTVAGSQYIT